MRVVHAQDAVFQDFFSGVCGGAPTGSLADRCGETPGGGGALSGDSQESLNPGQPLSSNDRTLARSRSQARQVQQRVEQLQDEAANGQTAQQSQDAMLDYGPMSVFINGRGTWFDRERNESDAERGFDGHTAGVQVGMDYRLSNRAVIGAMFTYDNADLEFDADQLANAFTPASNEGETDTDTYSLVLYGSYNFTDSFFFDGAISYGLSDYTFSRNVVFQETGRVVPQTDVRTEGDSDGRDFWVSSGVGYDLFHGALKYGPYARVTYARSEINGYTENDLTGSGLQLSVEENTRESLTSIVGVRGSYSISTNWGVLIPQARAEYEHEFDKDAQVQGTNFVLDAGGNQLTLTGDDPDRNYFNLGASLVAVLPNGWLPFLDFEALVGYQDLDRYRVTGGVRIEF